MSLGRLWRLTLGLILLSAFIPTAVVAATTQPKDPPAIRYADTADCPGKQPSGLILYITVPDDPTKEPRELIVAQPDGKVIRKIAVRNPKWLFPADQPGKAFVYTYESKLYLVDANKGTVKFVVDEQHSGWTWPHTYLAYLTPDFDWQILYGQERDDDDLLVNLNTGDAQELRDWAGADLIDDYEHSEITPDGEHIVLYFGSGLLKVGNAGEPRSLRTISTSADGALIYSPDGQSLIFTASTEDLSTGVMSIQLNDFAKQPKTLMKSAAPLDLFPVPNKNQALVVVRISDSESRIDTIDLQTGLQLASVSLPAYVERVYSGPEGFKRVVSGSDRDGEFIGILDTYSGYFNELELLRGYQMQAHMENPKWIFAYAEDSYEPWSDYLPIYGIEGNTGKIHENQIDELPYTDNTFQQFSDDGRYYLLLAELETGAKGFVVRDLGGNPSLVLGKGDSFGAVFSPEDCWIAYSSYQEFDPHPSNRISVLPVTGGTPKKIGEGTQPIWIMN